MKCLTLPTLVIFFIFFLLGCDNNEVIQSAPAIPELNYTIVNVYPHDTTAYTQGLFLHNNFLYESTGEYGSSCMKKVNIVDGKSVAKVTLASKFFGEGATLFKDKIYQLTWREHKVFVYDAHTLAKIKEFDFAKEGWGLTSNDTCLIASDGSCNLYFINPTTFMIEKTLQVEDNIGLVRNINELEVVGDFLFANIYLTDRIIKINATTGKVAARIDATGLLSKAGKHYDAAAFDNGGWVLNGIAYNPATTTFFLTGKKWPFLFELQLQ